LRKQKARDGSNPSMKKNIKNKKNSQHQPILHPKVYTIIKASSQNALRYCNPLQQARTSCQNLNSNDNHIHKQKMFSHYKL